MAGPNRIEQAPIRMSTVTTDVRQTPKTDFGSRIYGGVSATAGMVAGGLSAAAPIIPGGSVISAAVNGLQTFAGSQSSGSGTRIGMNGTSGAMGMGGGPTTASTSNADILQGQMQAQQATQANALAGNTATPTAGATGAVDPVNFMNMQSTSQIQFLMLQQQLQLENQKYTTLSNVMKVRHDTAKTAIGNLR